MPGAEPSPGPTETSRSPLPDSPPFAISFVKKLFSSPYAIIFVKKSPPFAISFEKKSPPFAISFVKKTL
jgi:hypothetical protein